LAFFCYSSSQCFCAILIKRFYEFYTLPSQGRV
jgi:hypothetical protein